MVEYRNAVQRKVVMARITSSVFGDPSDLEGMISYVLSNGMITLNMGGVSLFFENEGAVETFFEKAREAVTNGKASGY